MLKIVRPICCGIDVHKKFVVATIGTTNHSGVTDYVTRQFSTFTSDLIKLRSWLLEHDCRDVCMESTGKYWIPVFNILESECSVFVANPKYVKGIRGKKTDKKDALWLCDLHKHNLAPNSFIPPLPIRQIRDLMRYRFKLTNIASGEKNRVQNSLTVSNIMLSSVVSDTLGKSSTKILRHLLKDTEDTSFDVLPLLHPSMHGKAEVISQSIQGTLTPPQADKIELCLKHLDSVKSLKSDIEDILLKLAAPYFTQLELLLTMPGIKNVFTAIGIIGEIGVDMTIFPTAKHLCSWAGLVPQNNESAGKKKSVRVSRAGVYIKPLLVQCAHAVVRSKECPYFAFKYERLKQRRGAKKAILAIARMLLTCIYHILAKNEPFDEALYRVADPMPAGRNQPIDLAQAIALLESMGATITMPGST